jgi:PAS domain S-box-containing protein
MQNMNEVEHLKKRIKELEIEVQKKEEDRIQLESALKKDEVMLRNILEHSTNFFYSHTTDHVLSYLSPQIFDILGYKPEEAMIKWTQLASDHPMNNEGYKRTIAAIETGKVQEPYELELIHKQGKKVYVKVHEAPVVENGKTVAIVGSITDITDQKVAGSGLKQSEKKYSTLFEQAADGILVGVDKGEIVEANQSMLKLTGYQKSEIIGQNISILFDKNELQLKPFRYDLVKKGDTVISERNIIRKDGTLLPIEMNTKILEDGRMQALFRDISKRKEAENELIKSKNLLQRAEEIAGLGSFFYDVKNDKWESSEVLDRIYGIDKNYNKNVQNWLNIIHPDFKDEMREYLMVNILKKHETFDKEYKIRRISDQKELWVHGFGEIELDSANHPISVFGTIQDITERKNYEIALKSSEEKYRNIFYNSPLGILHYDMKGAITDCNDHFVSIIGSSREKLIGLNMITDLNNKGIIKAVEDSLQKGESYYEDWYTSVTAQKTSYVRILFKSITETGGKQLSGIGLVEDITEKKLAGDAKKVSEENFKNIYNYSSDIILILNRKGEAINVNKSVCNHLGYSVKEFIGKKPADYLFNADLNDVKQRIDKMFNKQKVPIKELVLVSRKGEKIPFEVNSKLIRYEGENAILSILRNIKERREFEQRVYEIMIETEEKERQRLASDIHDEIGPLLSSLKMYIDSLDKTKENEKQDYIKKKLQELIKESITNVREVSNALSPSL